MTTAITTPVQAQFDEFFLDTSDIRNFVEDVRRILAAYPQDVDKGLDALYPHFAKLLADQSWLPAEFAAPNPRSQMGGSIGTWLLFRSADRSLSLFSLVVPSGSETPVHDHLAWGYVGLYRGEQIETVYRRVDDGLKDEKAVLEVTAVNNLKPNNFYKLLPPDGDIHSVKTVSAEPSISIHLLANDTGCVVRHAFQPDIEKVRSFRSGYSNVACPDEATQ